MTPQKPKIEERIEELAYKKSPYGSCACRFPHEGTCENCKSVFNFKAGFLAALDLPELKALIEGIESAEQQEHIDDARVYLKQALTQWREFTKGSGDELL